MGAPTIERECEKHAAYTAKLIQARQELCGIQIGPIYGSCPACAQEHRQHEEEQSRQEAEAKLRNAIATAGIPRRFQHAEFATEGTPQLILRTYAKNIRQHVTDGTGLVLIGPCGTGKTHNACALLLELVRNDYPCGYVTADSLARGMRATFQRGAEVTESDLFEHYASLPLLLIDELAASNAAHTVTLLHELISVRYEQQLPSIFISNASRHDLEQYLGQRAADRLAETCRWVPMTGTSQRRLPALSTASNRGAA